MLINIFKNTQSISGLAFRLYLLVLIVAPLAFGTMETWSRAFMEAGIFLAALLFFIKQHYHSRRTLYRPPGLLPLLLFLAYLLLQITPLPVELLKIISPTAYSLRNPISGFNGPEGWLTISLAPKETLVEFFRFASYATAYFLTVQLLSRRERIVSTLQILITLAVLIAIEALFQRLTAGGLIYWFRAPPSATPTGPYVYHNHYAGFMAMLFPLTLCLFLYTKPYSEREFNIKQRLIAFFHDRQVNYHAFYGIGAAFIATTIFVSLSRGGIISLSCALLILALILHYRGQLGSNRYRFILIPSLTLVFVSWFGWEMIVERFLRIHHAEKLIYNSRFDTWSDTLGMIKGFIVTGSGFGSFEKIFPIFQEKSAWQLVIDHAHNDYLELVATGGLISLLLLTCFLSSILRNTWPVWRRRREQYVIFLGGGCLAAIISLLLHGFVDFNFYNGANGLYFFMICGLLVSIANSRDKRGRPPSMLKKLPSSRMITIAGVTGATVLLTFSLYFNLGVIKGEYRYRYIRTIALDASTPINKTMELRLVAAKLRQWDPLEAKYRYSAGNIALIMEDREAAAGHYRTALDLDPTDSWSLLQLGQLLAAENDQLGLKMMEAAIRNAPFDLEVLKRYSHLLLWLGEQEKALAVSNRILTIAKGGEEARKYFTLLNDYGVPNEDIHQGIPRDPAVLLAFGNFLAENKNTGEAVAIFEEVIALAAKSPAPQPWFFTGSGWFFLKQKDLPRAREAAERGISTFPDNPVLHYILGETLRRSEDLVRAETVFRRAIELAPGNSGYLRQLSVVQASMNKVAEAISSLRQAVELAPKDIGLRLMLAASLNKQEKAAPAAEQYKFARELLAGSEKPRPWHFNSLRHYYIDKGHLNEALSIMKKAVKTFPENHDLHIQLGNIYLLSNNSHRAELSYRKALELDPSNKTATDRLKKLKKNPKKQN